MHSRPYSNQGVVLFIVLGIIIFAAILGGVVLNIVLSNTGLSRKHFTRVQAFYAAKGGVNYGYERLIRNDDNTNWPTPAADASYTNCICNGTCTPACPSGGLVINDTTLSSGIQRIAVVVSGRDHANCSKYSPPSASRLCISAIVDFEPVPTPP